MTRVIRYAAASVLTAGAIVAAPAAAMAAPVVTGGLVNVTVTNVPNNNKVVVSIPIQAAANICGVSVLSLVPGQVVTCTSSPSQGGATFTFTR